MVEIFREVRRVLRKDGTLWLNLGDSYSNSTCGPRDGGTLDQWKNGGRRMPESVPDSPIVKDSGLKPKDLCGIPWRVALAFQADGWYLRQDIIWAKPNPMPESVTDRCTKAHEYIFLLTKSSRYFYDAEAIKEKSIYGGEVKDYTGTQKNNSVDPVMQATRPKGRMITVTEGRNKRSVWTVATAPYPEAHFATYPPDLIKPCIMAGTSAKGCCAKCGAPWERVIDRGELVADRKSVEIWKPIKRDDSRSAWSRPGGKVETVAPNCHYENKTLGWQPTCECDAIDRRIIGSPLGERAGNDPSLFTGRAGMNRPRGETEGQRPISRYEQQQYAKQLQGSPFREKMKAQAGTAFEHYIRTDESGARPVPDALLAQWIEEGLLERVTIPPAEDNVVPSTVLDCFAGSGTTGAVALELGRKAILIELNPKYVELIEQRCNVTMGLALA